MILNELIKYNDEDGIIVDSLDLHRYLGVKSRHNDWINRQIKNFGFELGVDYLYSKKRKTSEIGALGGRPTQNKELTLNMAKELAMVERSEKGREIRKYFIQLEKELKEIKINNIKAVTMIFQHKDKLNLTKNQLYPILENLGVLKENKQKIHKIIKRELVGKYENITMLQEFNENEFIEDYKQLAEKVKEEYSSYFIDDNQITIWDLLEG